MGRKVLALAGGVGGAKLALGLARVLSPEELVIVVNTGDDECFHGLHVSPDLDTMMYTLAGLSNPDTGWGIAGDTFNGLEMLQRYGADTWFNLGDRDLATHIRRTQLLREGSTLSQVTRELCLKLGVEHPVVPMCDGPVRTVVQTEDGELPMQEYFVRRRSAPRVTGVEYRGAATACPSAAFQESLDEADTVVFCPSNPFLSLGPILAVPGVKEGLGEWRPGRRRIAVSPLVGGAALRGPAAKMMEELGHVASGLGVARQYRDVCDTFLVDHQDAHLAAEMASLGLDCLPESIIMETPEDRVSLARRIVELGGDSK